MIRAKSAKDNDLISKQWSAVKPGFERDGSVKKIGAIEVPLTQKSFSKKAWNLLLMCA